MAYFLGIDGGGTSTRSAIGDEKRIIAKAASTGCNIVRLGSELATHALRESITAACRAAGIPETEIVCTCVGTAGVSVPSVRGTIRKAVSEIVSGSVRVCGDNEIALEAAFYGGPGVIVASGTGSIAYGQNGKGEKARAGGYGYAVSDDGSGHWIGRSAVAAMMRAIDSGRKTLLMEYVQEVWGAKTPAEVVKIANSHPNFAALFPIVLRAAHEGDSLACELLRDGGAELAELAVVVIKRLWPIDAEVPVATVGGVFENSDLVRDEFRRKLEVRWPTAKMQGQVTEPVLGALSLARKEWARQGAGQ